MSQLPTEDVTEVASTTERTVRNVRALGKAMHSARAPVSPAVARAVQAEQNLYDDIEREFGLLTSVEAGHRMGSRSASMRNAATAARRDGRLVALRRGGYWLFPGFQFDETGVRPLMADLIGVAGDHGWSEAGLVQWLASPTTYLGGKRPVDVLGDPERVLEAATEAFGVRW